MDVDPLLCIHQSITCQMHILIEAWRCTPSDCPCFRHIKSYFFRRCCFCLVTYRWVWNTHFISNIHFSLMNLFWALWLNWQTGAHRICSFVLIFRKFSILINFHVRMSWMHSLEPCFSWHLVPYKTVLWKFYEFREKNGMKQQRNILNPE